MSLALICFVIVLYVFWDVNYFVRSLFTLGYRRLFDRTFYNLEDVTTISGMCTFQDCDVTFSGLRLSRLIRELDIARYHFYDCTGIIGRSAIYDVSSLQGGTLVLHFENIPMFTLYHIKSKLIYWDDKSLFIEHEVVTDCDGKVRALVLSRQHAISNTCPNPVESILRGIWSAPPSITNSECPEYIKCWLQSIDVSSRKLRAESKVVVS